MDTRQDQFEKTVNTFIESVEKYFTTLTHEQVLTSPPFVKSADLLMLKECTGMIGISGKKKGMVYISGDLDLYETLIRQYVGLPNPTEGNKLDMAGEVANVVAGNVRETYGKDFMISVPVVFQGKPETLKFPDDIPIYIIPFQWKEHEAYMVVGID